MELKSDSMQLFNKVQTDMTQGFQMYVLMY